jgi:hydrogenase maturation protease
MRCAVIGLGNPLMGDDGAGIAVLDLLRGAPLPAGAALLDAGTPGPGLLHLLEGLDAAVLVDAADFGGAPGEVRAFDPGEVRRAGPAPPGLSLHEGDLLGVLALAARLGQAPARIRICAVQPARVAPDPALSPVVADALPALAEAVRLALRHVAGG